MRRISSLTFASGLAIAVLAGGAQAQFFYSSPPPLMGQPSYHLYSVPGVIDGGGLGTFFSCSNTTDANIRVGVDVFAALGGSAANDPSATSLDLAPGGSAIFGTGAATGISVTTVPTAVAASAASSNARDAAEGNIVRIRSASASSSETPRPLKRS